MSIVEFGRHTVEYKIALHRWAKRLEATEMVIHKNGAVTLTCPDGYICREYRPTAQELYRR